MEGTQSKKVDQFYRAVLDFIFNKDDNLTDNESEVLKILQRNGSITSNKQFDSLILAYQEQWLNGDNNVIPLFIQNIRGWQ